MQKRFLSIALSLCIVAALCGVLFVYANENNTSMVLISDKSYEISPDIKEREYITNNSSLTAQQMGHVLEVKLGNNAQIIAGYNDYNIETIKSGKNWNMRKTTEQAQEAETRRNINVVGAVNGDFFDMSNGRPRGALVMNGTVIQKGNFPCFYIDGNNVPHISYSAENMPDDVKEAIGGAAVLVADGEAADTTDNTKNPRTVIGIKADHSVVIYMVDGRQAPLSEGMSYPELAQTMIDLGCQWALNLDGGGSSTFATQRAGENNKNGAAGLTMRCSPSDGYERTVSSSLLVVSTASQDGKFDHAILSPSQEVYTPGSMISYTAKGADKSGAAADLPDNGLSWKVIDGKDLGTIDQKTGMFTATEEKTGSVTVALEYNGKQVGTTTVRLQWPDKLNFTNSSVSLDFGESSDLSFTPTWKGQKVHYKDGDFTWTLDAESYKYNTLIETKDVNEKTGFSGNSFQDMYIALNGNLNTPQKLQYSAYGTWWNYATEYMETSKEVLSDSQGNVSINAVVKNTNAWTYTYRYDNEDDPKLITGQDEHKVERALQKDQSFTFSIGKFSKNSFTADENNSFSGAVHVTLANNSSVKGSVDVIVGMEPYALMDFEDHVNKDGTKTAAKDYWTMHVGSSSDNGNNGQLTLDEMEKNRLWIRDTTGKGVLWPNGQNGIVSAKDDSNVRFGENACKLGWDFSKITESTVASADFGFSAIVHVDAVQPTKLGVWINVPKSLSEDDSILKSILVGNGGAVNSDGLAYWKMKDNGSMEFIKNQNITGTTTYFQYYSHNSDGTVSGSKLSDWAGKGWTWVEADISSLQMPVGIQRGYTIRITSPQNCTKGSGHIYIDNLQMIYGTNTNDVSNPVIESVVEKNSGINLKAAKETPEFTSGNVTFDIPISDNNGTDKYASGVDANSIHIYIDGRECTDKASISSNLAGNTVLLPLDALTNGGHSIKLKVKDYFGNETTESYSFKVNDEAGTDAAVNVIPQETAPVIGEDYKLNIMNSGDVTVDQVEVTIEVADVYIDSIKGSLDKAIIYGSSYEQDQPPKVENGKIKISAKRKTARRKVAASNNLIASILFHLPEDAKEGASFTYAVPEASYSVDKAIKTFSMAEEKIPLKAAYTITVGKAVVDLETTFKVSDEDGKDVEDAILYSDGQKITNPYIYRSGGRKTVYAETADGNRSWNLDIIVCDPGTDGDGKPYGMQNSASANGAEMRQFTWLSAIGQSQGKAYIRYSVSKDGIEKTKAIEGKSEIITFEKTNSGDAFRSNSVELDGLTPETVYYYQVGDGEKWSEVLSFATASDQKTADTNFFIFGDVQSNSTANLSAAIKKITSAEKTYAFGIQTGDAIDNVNDFDNWRGFLTTMNAKSLAGIDLIHVLGNHEYYGDPKGSVSGHLYGLPASGQGSYYSTEYGSVYTAVVNNGGDLLETLEKVKEDALKSKCTWKVLALHEPIYGTNEEMDGGKRLKVTKIIEDAGIDFVFSGDDHAYARTYPMVQDQSQELDSKNGVIYYVCGDLSSKDNAYHQRDYFAASIPHNDYQGMYMTAEADNEKITIKAYKYDGTLLDSFTKSRANCEIGKHTFNEKSIYNIKDQTLTCAICGEKVSAADSGYTGKVAADEKGHVVLAAGVVKTGWFTWIDDICHAGKDGLLHKTDTVDTATCTEDGHLVSTCECGDNFTGAYTYSKGHVWDEDHVCKVCGTKGIDMSEVTLTPNGKYWEYTGAAIRASVRATYGDYTLVAKSDRNGKDAYISYTNNINIGMGTVTFEGRGDFYGKKSVEFPIVPKSVNELTDSNILSTAVSLKWDAADGAEYYRIYQKKGNSEWQKAGTTEDTSMIITGLIPETQYTFRVASSTDVDGETFNCLHWSNELSVMTKEKNADSTEDKIDGITASVTVGGRNVEIPMTKTTEGRYLLLPAATDLTALRLNVKADGKNQPAAYIGTNGSQDVEADADVDITTLTGKPSGTSHTILVCLAGCEPMKLHVMKSKSLPAMYLTSDDPKSKGRSYVDASKSNAVTAGMTMVKADGSVVYDSTLKQLKARGNSTFTYYDKKSYQIKLTEGSDLLGTGENVKTWVLLAGYGDATQMHDKLFKDLAAKMGLNYVASCNWVDLYYDGEYRGTYLLSEKNSVNKTGVPITDMEKLYEQINENYGDNVEIKTAANDYNQTFQYTAGLNEIEPVTGGYLLERNLEEIDEASGFYTRQGGGFNVKSPEYAGEKAMKYISEYYQEFEDAVYAKDEDGNYTGYNAKTGKYYYEYCDMTSLVKTFLLQELALNPDGFLSSFYFYKDVDGLMYAGPIWDQEMTLGTGWNIEIKPDVTDYHYLAEALIRIPDFKTAVEDYYKNSFSTMVKDLTKNGGVIDGYQTEVAASADMNYVLWPYVRIGRPSAAGHLWSDGTTYKGVVKDMVQWINKRLAKLSVLFGDGTEHTEHSYTSKITKEPTYTEEGVRTYTCTICGNTYTEVIAKLVAPSGGGTPENPGDDDSDKIIAMKDVRALAAKEGTSLDISLGQMKISFDNKALGVLAKSVKDDSIHIIAEIVDKEKQSEVQKKAAGDDGQVIIIKVVHSGGTIEDFAGGSITITLLIPENLKSEEAIIVQIDKDGTYALVPGKLTTKNGKDYYVFTLKSLADTALTDSKTAENIMIDQENKILQKGVQKTSIKLKSSFTKSGYIRLSWAKSKGYKIDYYQIYRSVKKNKGYGSKAFYVTKDGKKTSYVNTKKIKKGTRYYYKVRGVRIIEGKKYYTEWSGKAWRTSK